MTHIDHPGCVTLFEVKQHGGLVEEGEHGHVFNLIVLWRVLGVDVFLLVGHFLERKEDHAWTGSVHIRGGQLAARGPHAAPSLT